MTEKFLFEYEILHENSISDCEIISMLMAAQNAIHGAYAPYSEFRVGCAILLDNGQTLSASNQENAAYPSGLCAERTALFYYGSHFRHRKIKAMAVSAEIIKGPYVSPCGACRQVMLEYAGCQNEPITFYFKSSEPGIWIKISDLKFLLPFPFDKF